MLGLLFTNPLLFAIWIVALLVAITIHEFAHAYTADYLGDPTPRSQGRLTLNPLAHLDPIGTLMLLLFRFGWGRPVQFDPHNLDNPRQDAAKISIAGPVSNLILAFLASIVARFIVPAFYAPMFYPVIFLNVALAIFNLVPVHPLDGGKIILGLLPRDLAYEWDTVMHRYGIIILLLLIIPVGGTSPIISLIYPIVDFILSILLPGISLL